jgi:hypothetical protein
MPPCGALGREALYLKLDGHSRRLPAQQDHL